jgi:hypothetical protein
LLWVVQHLFRGESGTPSKASLTIFVLSERSRRIVMGHSTATDTSGGYGPKAITEEQAEVVLNLGSVTCRSKVSTIEATVVTQSSACPICPKTGLCYLKPNKAG